MTLNYSDLFCLHVWFPAEGLASRLQNLSAPVFCLVNRYSSGLHGVSEKIAWSLEPHFPVCLKPSYC